LQRLFSERSIGLVVTFEQLKKQKLNKINNKVYKP
jgi:hypothetical protein